MCSTSRRQQTFLDYWRTLTDEDKAKYRQLRQRIDPLSFRSARHELALKFQVVVREIQQYCIRSDEDDWKRCVICGIVWLDGALTISTRQLRRLIGKCKSSINAGFQSLGYETSSMSSHQVSELMRWLSLLVHHGPEAREWTIRSVPDPANLSASAVDHISFGVGCDAFDGGIDSCDLTLCSFRDEELSCTDRDLHSLLHEELKDITSFTPHC
jgi:hypothetical protein